MPRRFPALGATVLFINDEVASLLYRLIVKIINIIYGFSLLL